MTLRSSSILSQSIEVIVTLFAVDLQQTHLPTWSLFWRVVQILGITMKMIIQRWTALSLVTFCAVRLQHLDSVDR